MHKVVFRLHNKQQKWKENAKYLKVFHTTIAIVHEWSMEYKGARLELMKKKMQQTELEKTGVQMLIQCNKELISFIADIQASYAQLYNIVDFMVKSHNIPSVGSLIEAKGKNKITQEIEEYLDQLMYITTKEYLEVNKHNM